MEPLIITVSPGAKRKYRDGSPDSMDTNHASLGSDSGSRAGDFLDDPFVGGDDYATELMDFPPPPAPEAYEERPYPMPGPEDETKGREVQEVREVQEPREMQEKMGSSSPFLTRGPRPATTSGSLDLDMTVPDDHA